MTTAQAVITRAQNRVPFFDPRLCPPAVTLGLLSERQRDLAFRAQQLDPSYLTAAYEITSPITPGTGITLPDHAYLLGEGFITRSGGGKEPFALQSAAYEPTVRLGGWAGYELNRQLYPLGDSEWADVAKLTVYYGQIPADLAALGDTLLLPDGTGFGALAFNALVAGLALDITHRLILAGVVLDNADIAVRILGEAVQQAEGSFFGSIGRQGIAEIRYDVQVR